MIEIGTVLSNRYTITEHIGHGGMANVFLAHDAILNRDVAVKVLRFDFQDNQDAIRRFQREAVSAAQLLHHNIVELYDVEQTVSQQYLVMEYVKGKDLKTYIEENSPLSLELTVSIMSQILSAIEVAHRNNIIHRDIKPQNVLITDRNLVKITDFGIAIALSDTSITQTNTFLGSVHYLSPEQARGASATIKSDIYALGVVLYELITGSVPYTGESAVSIALKHFQESFPRIKDRIEYVPQSLENVVLKATAKNPEDRYDSVEEMQHDLMTVLSANRMNEPMFMPQSRGNTKVIKPIKSGLGTKDLSKVPQVQVEDQQYMFDYASEEKKRRFPSVRWLLLILLVAFISVGGYFLYMQTTQFVAIPNLVNMTEEEASQALNRLGLNKGEVRHQWDSTIPSGDVISSNPDSGTRVRKNSSVNLLVSNGQEQVELGNYVGERYEPIRKELTDMNFIVVRRGIATSDPSQVGVILSQSVEPGSKVVPANTTITFTVGQMSDTISMQDFQNLPLSMVQNFAEEYGLQVSVSYEYDNYIPVDRVISQDPVNGTSLTPGDTIAVTVSQGPKETEILSHTESFNIEYTPRYADADVKQENPLPNVVEVYIGDAYNNINNVYQRFEVTESVPIQVLFYIPSDGVAQYRIVKDGEVYAESNAVYPN